MTAVQERLRAEVASRLRAARPECADRHDLSTTEGLLTAYAAATAGDQDTLATVIIGRLDLAAWIRGTCELAFGLTRERAAAWRSSFTRTIFLAGNPKNLRGRFAFDHVAEDESAAWVMPGPAAESAGLRRLLKLFAGTAPLGGAPEEVEVAAARPRQRPALRRDLDISTAGCTVADALVHLNHLLVEAVFDGLIAPGDRLALRYVPRLSGTLDAYVALRVAIEHAEPDRLRAFAGLTEGHPLAP